MSGIISEISERTHFPIISVIYQTKKILSKLQFIEELCSSSCILLLFHLICRREQPHWSGLKECGNGPRNQVSHQNNQNQPTLLLCPSYVHKLHLCPSIHLLLVLKNMYTRCTMCTSSTPSKFFEVIASPAFQFKCWNAGNLGPDDILVSTHVDEIMSRWHF